MFKFKKVITSALVVAMIATMSVSAFAATEVEKLYPGGSEIVTGTTKTGMTSGPMDGGYWIRGKRDGKVVSEYKHYTGQGHASTVNGAGYYHSGGWQPTDVFSKSNVLDWTFWGTNKVYYNFR